MCCDKRCNDLLRKTNWMLNLSVISVEKDLKVVFFFSADERILKLWAPPCSSTETATPL